MVELYLGFWVRRRYWFSHLSSLAANFLFFYAMVIGVRNLVPDYGLEPGPLLLIFVALQFILVSFQSVAFALSAEASQGTLEHLALARGGLLRQILFRTLAETLYALLWSLFIFLALFLAVGFRPELGWGWPLAFLPLLLAAMGFALGMGGLALYFKQIAGFFNLLQFLFLPYFFSLVRFEPWMAYLPFAPGVQLLRLSLTGEPLPLGLMGLALLQGLLFLALGFGALAWVYALVRRKGILGRY